MHSADDLGMWRGWRTSEIPATIFVLVYEDCVVGVVHVFVCVLPAGFHVLREEQQQQQ